MSRGVSKGVMETCGFHKIKVDPFAKGFDMGLAKPLSRSVGLNGFSTCLRLEQIYWNILTEIARLNTCSVSALLSYVDREVHLRYGGVKNFSGLVRVVCVVHVLKGRDALTSADTLAQ